MQGDDDNLQQIQSFFFYFFISNHFIMKKTLLLAAASLAAVSANAEVFDYGFSSSENPNFPFLVEVMNPESDLYGGGGNVDLVSREGIAMPNTIGLSVINTPEGEEKGILDLGIGISFLDGQIYKLTPDATVYNDEDFEIEMMPEENLGYPFLSWGEKGVTRTIFMPGWGSEDAWEDKDYNGATEADWVATKNGIQFTRLGTKNIVSRQDTYIQYPPVTGNVTVTVWAGTNLGGTANQDNILEVLVTPVVDGVAQPDLAVVLSKESPVNKRYYKFDPITFDATGKSVAFQVGPNRALINLMYVRIEGDAIGGESGLENIIANDENVVAPVYNVLGQRVNENYKGLVIKNGKKFVQK